MHLVGFPHKNRHTNLKTYHWSNLSRGIIKRRIPYVLFIFPWEIIFLATESFTGYPFYYTKKSYVCCTVFEFIPNSLRLTLLLYLLFSKNKEHGVDLFNIRDLNVDLHIFASYPIVQHDIQLLKQNGNLNYHYVPYLYVNSGLFASISSRGI